MAKRIAVTGSTGFIGTHLVKALENIGNTVIPITREITQVECDVIYHLACPSTTEFIVNNTQKVMDIIIDGTRNALSICPDALFVNASSIGAEYIDNTAQGAYNIAKRCMEIYLEHSNVKHVNYRLPAVYGIGMSNDSFIKRCIDGRAYFPSVPGTFYFIAHISEVVDAMVNLRTVQSEKITLGQIYELFNSGRRGLYRPASD